MSCIDWTRHFDRAICIHFVGNASRLPSAEREFRRVGLPQSGIFEWRYTFPDPWEVRLLDSYKGPLAISPNRRTAVGFLNLGLESCRIMREAAAMGWRRVLFLEDDVRFLKDLSALAAALDAIPEGYDIVQFDKFAPWELKQDEYEERFCRGRSVNDFYFDAHEGFWMSGGCFMATARGMANMLKGMEEWRPGPMDGYLNMNGNTHAAAKRNLAVQVMQGDALCMEYAKGENTHHKAYRPQGVRYEDYAVPDGYGYGVKFAEAD